VSGALHALDSKRSVGKRQTGVRQATPTCETISIVSNTSAFCSILVHKPRCLDLMSLTSHELGPLSIWTISRVTEGAKHSHCLRVKSQRASTLEQSRCVSLLLFRTLLALPLDRSRMARFAKAVVHFAPACHGPAFSGVQSRIVRQHRSCLDAPWFFLIRTPRLRAALVMPHHRGRLYSLTSMPRLIQARASSVYGVTTS